MTQRNLVFQLSSKSEGLSTGPHPNLTWTQVRAAPSRRATPQVAAVPTLPYTLPHTATARQRPPIAARAALFFLYHTPAKGSYGFACVFVSLKPHVLRRLERASFLIEVKSIPLCFMDETKEPASRTTLCLLHPHALSERPEESRTWVPLPGEAFLVPRGNPEVTEQVDEGSGPRTWSPQWSESAGPGLGSGSDSSFLSQGCLPGEAGVLREAAGTSGSQQGTTLVFCELRSELSLWERRWRPREPQRVGVLSARPSP